MTRRATAADFDAIRSVYDAWAIEQNGPLSRRGVSFAATAEDFLDSFTGVTVALDAADRVCGYASWNRGQGYGEDVGHERDRPAGHNARRRIGRCWPRWAASPA